MKQKLNINNYLFIKLHAKRDLKPIKYKPIKEEPIDTYKKWRWDLILTMIWGSFLFKNKVSYWI